MLIYETKINFFQYFMSALGCFYVIPIYYWSFYTNENNDLFIYLIGIIFFTLALIQFLYTLKKFLIYDEYLIVKRPFFFQNYNRIFYKKEIEKINFRISGSRIGGGINLVVFKKKTITNFQVICRTKTLKDLIENLKGIGITTNVEFKIK